LFSRVIETSVSALHAFTVARYAPIASGSGIERRDLPSSPVVTDKIVPADEASRPRSEVKFKQREVRAKGGRRDRSASPIRAEPS
jgi:hypothetical protein